MCPQWNTTERGQTREGEESEYEGDWDGLSCSSVGPDREDFVPPDDPPRVVVYDVEDVELR